MIIQEFLLSSRQLTHLAFTFILCHLSFCVSFLSYLIFPFIRLFSTYITVLFPYCSNFTFSAIP